jgi:hypothetical protein
LSRRFTGHESRLLVIHDDGRTVILQVISFISKLSLRRNDLGRRLHDPG